MNLFSELSRFSAITFIVSVLLVSASHGQADWRSDPGRGGAGYSGDMISFRNCDYPASPVGDYVISMVFSGETFYLTRAQHSAVMNNKVGIPEACTYAPGPRIQMGRGRGVNEPVDLDAIVAGQYRAAPPVAAGPTARTPVPPAATPRAPGTTQAPSINAELDKIITADARSWLINSYNIGSARNGQIIDSDDRGFVVYGEYTFNGSSTGWLKVLFEGERVRCVEYHDFAGTCRAIGQNPSNYLALAALGVVVLGTTSSGSSGGGGSGSGDNGYQQCVAACNSQGYANDPGRDAAFRNSCIRNC